MNARAVARVDHTSSQDGNVESHARRHRRIIGIIFAGTGWEACLPPAVFRHCGALAIDSSTFTKSVEAGRLPITVVVVTWQEAENIAACLDSVREWVDEVIVADMGSPDGTSDIAAARGAKVIRIERHPICEPGRVPAVREARNDWILVLDADEQISTGLAREIDKAVRSDDAKVYLLPRANLALSGFAPHEAGFPEYKLRLFRRSAVDLDGYQGHIHTFFDPLPGVGVERLPASFPDCCLLHFTNPALGPFLDKVNRYTSQDALSRPGWDRTGWRELAKPFWIFLRRYVKEKGWKDGWRGFWLCWISGVYEGIVLAKLWEMSLHEGRIPDAGMARSRMRKIADGRS